MNEQKERSEFLKWFRDLYPLMESKDEEAIWMYEGWMARARWRENIENDSTRKNSKSVK